jgi:hypothetical protein
MGVFSINDLAALTRSQTAADEKGSLLEASCLQPFRADNESSGSSCSGVSPECFAKDLDRRHGTLKLNGPICRLPDDDRA